MIRRNLLAVLVIVCSGCASYVTPGGPARLDQIDRPDIAAIAARRPTAKFPARLAIVRIQSPDYRSYSTDGDAPGSYSRAPFKVILTQELLIDRQMEALLSWPSVAGAAPVSRLMIPPRLDSIDDLRLAGAKIQADILLVYTVDTSFRIQGKGYGPLTAISLGMIPDRDAYITATASAILIDVRSGFVYGVAEATAKTSGLTSVWKARDTVDRKRIEAEEESFGRLMDQLTKTWSGIVKQYQ